MSESDTRTTIGTGTTIVHFADNRTRHMGGTGIGGGTIFRNINMEKGINRGKDSI